MPLTADARRKLVGLLGRLGSDNDNERLNAARLIEAGRKGLGLQWDDLIAPATIVAYRAGPIDLNKAGPARKETSGSVGDIFADMADFLAVLDYAEHGASTTKEMEFVADMKQRAVEYGMRTFVSEAQLAWLSSLADRVV